MKNKDQILLGDIYNNIILESNPDAMDLNVSQKLFQDPEYIDLNKHLDTLYRVFKSSKTENDRIKLHFAIIEVHKKLIEMEKKLNEI